MICRLAGAKQERLEALWGRERLLALREGGAGKQRGCQSGEEGETGISHIAYVGIGAAGALPPTGDTRPPPVITPQGDAAPSSE